ncbi:MULTISPECIES: hypothetical protein [Bacillus]|uniref:Uncharacterized protein n=1 Tax=Bacillus cereus TaxID=1396 RepID=A0A9X6B587_BACCE|nr:hypothetical protein [Bacillus cereus]OOR72277.1 hypothetical protein BLX06_25770 [Bacillus cereus]
MLYSELTFSLQQSFRSDLFKVLRYYLEDTNYACVTENTPIMTDSFVAMLVVYFQGSNLFLKWELMGFEIDIISCKKILHEIETAMRQRNSTLKQRNYFYSLLRDIGIQENIPRDLLCLKKRLLELEMLKLQQETKKECPNPMQKIKILQNM